MKTLLPNLDSDFSLVAFLNYIFYYLDLSPFNTKPLLECQPMTQYQKIEKNIGDWELVLQSWGHFFKFLVSFIITMKAHFHCTKITFYLRKTNCLAHFSAYFVGLAYRGKDIVFRFIIEYSSLRDFGP